MSNFLTDKISQSTSLQKLVELLQEQYDSGGLISDLEEQAIVERIGKDDIRKDLTEKIVNLNGDIPGIIFWLLRLVPDNGLLSELFKEIIEKANQGKIEAGNKNTSEFFPT